MPRRRSSLGEGEIAFTDLCRFWLREETVELTDVQLPGRPAQRSAARINHMDDLPFPAHDQLRLALSQGAAFPAGEGGTIQ